MWSSRKTQAERQAFTLVEMLIVVVIIGILAATVLPLIPEMQRSAGESALKQNLIQVRMAIGRYAQLHAGRKPAEVSDGIHAALSELCFLEQLRMKTDEKGQLLKDPNTPGAIGPFLTAGIPPVSVGKLSGERTVNVVDMNGRIQADAQPAHAWKYNARTGEFICNSNMLCSTETSRYWEW